MSKINQSTFSQLLKQTQSPKVSSQKKILMPFQVIGDPDLNSCRKISETLIENGADILEFGIPFSDPIADGPIIQLANQRARKTIQNTDQALQFLKTIKQDFAVPISLLVYHNLLYCYGYQKFIDCCTEIGIDSILVIDLPLQALTNDHLSLEFFTQLENSPIHPVFIATELTSNNRLTQLVTKVKDSYIYLLSHLGVTGITKNSEHHSSINASLTHVIHSIKKIASIPVLVGFGISSPLQVKHLLNTGVDGIIIGSALIQMIQQYHSISQEAMLKSIAKLLRSIRKALDQ